MKETSKFLDHNVEVPGKTGKEKSTLSNIYFDNP